MNLSRISFLALLLSLLFSSAHAITLNKNDLIITAKVSVLENIVNSYINITNLRDEQRNLTIYSYAYSNGSSLTGAWSANKINAIISGDGASNVVLENHVFVDGIHNFKIKITEGENKMEIKTKIKVGQSLKSQNQITGDVIKKNSNAKFLAASLLGIGALFVATRKV